MLSLPEGADFTTLLSEPKEINFDTAITMLDDVDPEELPILPEDEYYDYYYEDEPKIVHQNSTPSFQSVTKTLPESVPKIGSLLKELDVTSASFFGDLGKVLGFYGNPERAQLLLEVVKLLPSFTSEELEAILNIKTVLDKIPQPDEILRHLLTLPLQMLTKLINEDLDVLRLANATLLSELSHEATSLLLQTFQYLNILSSSSLRTKVMSQCRHESLHIECIDDTVDLCPNGHYYYGLAGLS